MRSLGRVEVVKQANYLLPNIDEGAGVGHQVLAKSYSHTLDLRLEDVPLPAEGVELLLFDPLSESTRLPQSINERHECIGTLAHKRRHCRASTIPEYLHHVGCSCARLLELCDDVLEREQLPSRCLGLHAEFPKPVLDGLGGIEKST